MNGADPRPLAVIETGRLRVCFECVDGRIQHSVWAIDGGEEELLLKSVDGLTGADEFSTPVLTQLQIPTTDDARSTVLAVGAAARDHWSLSAVADASTGRILFDVACRVQSPRGALGVAYLSNIGVRAATGISLTHPSGGRFELDIISDDSSSPDGGWRTLPDGRIEWMRLPPKASAFTLRWQYALATVEAGSR